MMFNKKSLKLTDLSEAEKKQLEKDGYVGDECGDGYPPIPVATFDKECAYPYDKGKYYPNYFELNLTEYPVGCIVGGKKFEGVEGSNANLFYEVEPQLCNTIRHSNIMYFDNLVEAIRYYNEIKSFVNGLPLYKDN